MSAQSLSTSNSALVLPKRSFTLASATSLTVNDPRVSATSVILFSRTVAGGTIGDVYVSAIVAGTSFTVACVNTDTSTFSYVIL